MDALMAIDDGLDDDDDDDEIEIEIVEDLQPTDTSILPGLPLHFAMQSSIHRNL